MARSSKSLREAVALVAPALAYVLQKLIWPYIPPSPQLLFYPAVFAAARIGGARAGYVASVLSALAITWEFLPPEGLAVGDPRDVLDLLIFLAVSIAMSNAVGRLAERIARERAAKEAMKATWSMIAHDLRTPLNTIQLGSDLLAHRADRETDPYVRRHAEIIERSSVRAASLVQDALDAMRVDDGTLAVAPRPCSVRELVSRVADEAAVVAGKAGIRVETKVSTTHATVVCDAARITQVLANLLANAVRFTPKGGIIAVVAEDDTRFATDVRISVRDTGKGIAKADVPHVFEKDWTKGGNGTGLGLWIAQSIIIAHARKLSVSSAEGRGTEFTFSLPASD